MTVDDVLGGFGNHDAIVPAESQRGGLSDSATTTFQNVDHLGEVGGEFLETGIGGNTVGLNKVAPQIADKVIGLLQESPNSSSFGYFSALPSNAGKGNSDFVDGCKSTEALKKAERTVRDDQPIDDTTYIPDFIYLPEENYSDAVITFEPMPETRVNPGQTIQIRLDIANGDLQEGAMISIGDSLLVVEGNPPYLFDYTVPEDRFGKMDISIQTFNSDLETETYAVESSIIVNLPYLGIGYLAKDGIIQASPGATFFGGSSVEYGTFLRENVITTDQEVKIMGSLLPQPEHTTEEEAVALAVVFYLKEDFLKVDGASSENCNPALADSIDKGGYYTIEYDSSEFKFDGWDGNMDNLLPLYYATFSLDYQSSLEPLENGIPLFKGQFEPGHACFYFGYYLRGGTIVFNGEQTINVRIKP